MPGVHCLALSDEFARVLTVARVTALGSAGVYRSWIASSCRRSIRKDAVSTELTRGSRSAPLRGDPSTLLRNSAFLPERIDRSCCWGWAAQLLHSCCERTERHGPAKSKDEDGTYYLSSRIQEMEVLTLLGTNFLLSEERGTKVAKVKRATRLALASISRPMGLTRWARTTSAGPIAAQDATTLRRRAPEPAAPARSRS